MSRAAAFPAVAAAAWGAVVALAVLGSRGFALPGSFTLCPVRVLTGCLCPGCGMGHSVVSAMRGNFAASFAHHPLGLPLLVLWTAWLAWGSVNRYRGRDFSDGFLPPLRRPAFAWAALTGVIAVHLARTV